MYGKNFKMVVVKIDKRDYAKENLIEDLPWKLRITECDKGDFIVFKNLLRNKEVVWLNELVAASPYGDGYNIEIDGYDFDDPRCRKMMRECLY